VTRRELRVVLILSLAALASAIAVVYAKYLTRLEFVTLQTLIDERQALEVQWGRLRLEEAALTTHPRVEERARQLLGMHLPQGAEVRVIEGVDHGR
jgi:cell division protein FtsL